MKKITTFVSIVMGILIMPLMQIANAESLESNDPICNFGDPDSFSAIESMFYGKWQSHHQKGFVSVGGMIMPFPGDDKKDYIEIKREDDRMITTTNKDGSTEIIRKKGRLIGTHPEMQQPMVFEWANEPAWAFRADAKKNGMRSPILSSDDLELVLGCGVEDIPRLIGRTTANVDGMVMNFTWRLMITSKTSMFVVMHASGNMQGTEFNSWRTVALNR